MAEGDRDLYRREQAALAREKEIMKDVKGWEVRTPLRRDDDDDVLMIPCDCYLPCLLGGLFSFWIGLARPGKVCTIAPGTARQRLLCCDIDASSLPIRYRYVILLRFGRQIRTDGGETDDPPIGKGQTNELVMTVVLVRAN
jgi:hypothetical protein